MVPVHAILIFTNMIFHYQYNGTYISKKHAECQIHVLVEDNAKCNDFKITVHLVLDNTMYTPERTSEEET